MTPFEDELGVFGVSVLKGFVSSFKGENVSPWYSDE